MKIKSVLLVVVLTLIRSGLILKAQPNNLAESFNNAKSIFEEKDGLVVIEAEYFYKQSKSGIRRWYKTSKNKSPKVDKDEQFYSDASNEAYIELLPDTRVTHSDKLIHGENFSNEPGTMAILHYKVNIKTPGRYYVWVRAYSSGSEDNSIHVGFDHRWPAQGQRMQWCQGKNNWTWDSRQRTKEAHCGVPKEIYLDITNSGVHDIQFSMREDGFRFDKFILTTDSSFVPTEESPKATLNVPLESHFQKISPPTIRPPSGRIAIIADGNSPDPDDLGATAVSIALLRATRLEDRLVHYSHSCDLQRVERISEAAERERHAFMQSSCDVTARRWGGFESLTFYDAKWQQDKTVKDLTKAINASNAKNPLWIIEAGEPDIIGFALDASSKDKHRFVKVITHHPANDHAGDFYTWQQILDFGIEEIRIPDQNTKLKVDIALWDWAKNHPDPRMQWLWIQGKIAEVDDVVNFQKGKWDCSDAGMVLYWVTGATNKGLTQGTVADIKALLLDYINDTK